MEWGLQASAIVSVVRALRVSRSAEDGRLSMVRLTKAGRDCEPVLTEHSRRLNQVALRGFTVPSSEVSWTCSNVLQQEHSAQLRNVTSGSGARTPMSPSLPDDIAWTILERMLLIRRFEEAVLRLSYEKQFVGHYHLYIGQEATGAAAMSVLEERDYLATTHRNHGHAHCPRRRSRPRPWRKFSVVPPASTAVAAAPSI